MFTCLLAWRELCFLTSSFHVLASRTASSLGPCRLSRNMDRWRGCIAEMGEYPPFYRE